MSPKPTCTGSGEPPEAGRLGWPSTSSARQAGFTWRMSRSSWERAFDPSPKTSSSISSGAYRLRHPPRQPHHAASRPVPSRPHLNRFRTFPSSHSTLQSHGASDATPPPPPLPAIPGKNLPWLCNRQRRPCPNAAFPAGGNRGRNRCHKRPFQNRRGIYPHPVKHP